MTTPCDRLPLAINVRLPEDIAVQAAFEVDDGFNAIGSCLKKRIYLPDLQFAHQQSFLCAPRLFLSQGA